MTGESADGGEGRRTCSNGSCGKRGFAATGAFCGECGGPTVPLPSVSAPAPTQARRRRRVVVSSLAAVAVAAGAAVGGLAASGSDSKSGEHLVDAAQPSPSATRSAGASPSGTAEPGAATPAAIGDGSGARGIQVVLSASSLDGSTVTSEDVAEASSILGRRFSSSHLAADIAVNGRSLVVTATTADRDRLMGLVSTGELRFRQVLAAASDPTAGPAAGAAPDSPVPGSGSSDLATVQHAFDRDDCATGLRPVLGTDAPGDYVVACSKDRRTKYLLAPSTLTGTQVKSAAARHDAQTDAWIVDITFAAAGAQDWFDLTRRAYEASPTCAATADAGGCNQVAITLDGIVESAPVVMADGIAGGATEISGNLSRVDAEGLADVLSFGALPVKLLVQSVSERSQ